MRLEIAGRPPSLPSRREPPGGPPDLLERRSAYPGSNGERPASVSRSVQPPGVLERQHAAGPEPLCRNQTCIGTAGSRSALQPSPGGLITCSRQELSPCSTAARQQQRGVARHPPSRSGPCRRPSGEPCSQPSGWRQCAAAAAAAAAACRQRSSPLAIAANCPAHPSHAQADERQPGGRAAALRAGQPRQPRGAGLGSLPGQPGCPGEVRRHRQ